MLINFHFDQYRVIQNGSQEMSFSVADRTFDSFASLFVCGSETDKSKQIINCAFPLLPAAPLFHDNIVAQGYFFERALHPQVKKRGELI